MMGIENKKIKHKKIDKHNNEIRKELKTPPTQTSLFLMLCISINIT